MTKLKFKHWYLNNPITNWGGRWHGIVLYPNILFRDTKDEVSQRLYRHELEHIYQIQRIGRFRYYLKYWMYWFKHGYRNNPYEVAARAVQYNDLTAEEQKLWDES